MWQTGERIESVVLNQKENTIEVVKRKSSGSMYASNPPQPVPDIVWKEVYGVVDGKIKLISTKEGKHIPSRVESEKIIFE